MSLVISVKITDDGLSGLGRRQMQKVGRDAIRRAAEYWWARILPIHFTLKGAEKYEYDFRQGENDLRKGSYQWKKKNRMKIAGVRSIGELVPLVWSGTSRRLATSTKSIKARAPNYRTYQGSAAINAPALNFVRKGYDEVTRITPDEVLQLQKVFLIEFEKQLNALGRTHLPPTTTKAA